MHHQAYKVHVDQSWLQVKDHVYKAFGPEKGAEMMKQRFQIINVRLPLSALSYLFFFIGTYVP